MWFYYYYYLCCWYFDCESQKKERNKRNIKNTVYFDRFFENNPLDKTESYVPGYCTVVAVIIVGLAYFYYFVISFTMEWHCVSLHHHKWFIGLAYGGRKRVEWVVPLSYWKSYQMSELEMFDRMFALLCNFTSLGLNSIEGGSVQWMLIYWTFDSIQI